MLTLVQIVAILSYDFFSPFDQSLQVDHQRLRPSLQLAQLLRIVGIIFVQAFVDVALKLSYRLTKHLPSCICLLPLVNQLLDLYHLCLHALGHEFHWR